MCYNIQKYAKMEAAALIRRYLSFIIALLMCLSLSGCIEPVLDTVTPAGQAKAEADSGLAIANPVREMSREELVDTCGIELNFPENAEDINYSIIELKEYNPIAQLRFSFDGIDYCMRGQYVGSEKAEDISGLYYEWELKEHAYVDYCYGVVYISGEVGYIKWLDAISGTQYSLSMSNGAKKDALIQMAELLFEPGQDKAD